MARLKAHHVDFNTLTVVGKHNVGHTAGDAISSGGGIAFYSVYPAGKANDTVTHRCVIW